MMSTGGTPASSEATARSPEPAGPLPGRIIVGVDGSAASEDALKWAVDEAALRGAEVHAVIAWSTQGGFGDVWMILPDLDYAADARKALEASIERAVGASPAVVVHQRVVEGHPATALLHMATPEDVLVVGSHGHGGFVGSLIGSVSQRVVSHAECPVVIVRRPAKPESKD